MLSSLSYSGAGCSEIDTPGLRPIYVIHQSAGTSGSRFRILAGPGLTMTYVSETHHFTQTVGDVQSGITVCYDGGCLAGERLVATIDYMCYGTTSSYGELMIVAHPGAKTVEVMDCASNPASPQVRNFGLLETSTCGECPPVHSIAGTPLAFGCTLPTEPTTWGKVKAFYR